MARWNTAGRPWVPRRDTSGQRIHDVRGRHEFQAAGAVVAAGVGAVALFDGPLLVYGADAIAETPVNAALGGEQGGQGFASFVDAIDLVPHHLRHDAATGVRRLHLHVGHAGDHRRATRYRHLQQMRVAPADDLPVLETRRWNGSGRSEAADARGRGSGGCHAPATPCSSTAQTRRV